MSRKIYYFAKGRYILEDISQSKDMDRFLKEQEWNYTVSVNCKYGSLPKRGIGISYNGQSVIERTENGWMFWRKNIAGEPKEVACVSEDYSNIIIYAEYDDEWKKDSLDYILSLIRTIYDAILPYNGGSIIHASCVKHKDRALLFLAPSRTGKSTQMKLWMSRFDAVPISSDAPAVFAERSGGESILKAYGMPWDGSDQIITQENTEITAFIEIRQAKYNSLRRLTERQAFRLLMHQGHMPLWDQQAMYYEMAVIKKISKEGKFYRLNCLPEASAAELVEDAIFGGNDLKIITEDIEMKVKEGYELRNVIDENIVMPTGEKMKDFGGALVLSDSAAFVWEKLQKNVTREELVADVTAEYEVERSVAEHDIDELIKKLKDYDLIEEN